jgi:hypothetical protein
MRSHFPRRTIASSIFLAAAAMTPLFAQEAPPAPSVPLPVGDGPVNAPTPTPKSDPIAVPTGTRLPLMLRNGINTRTAKAGDSVYFETAYPIAQNNRIVIPMGSFVRGTILEAKRPGLIKGRGQFRLALQELTFPNGYVVSLAATPSSADRGGREGVDSEGRIIGPSGSGNDKMLILTTTGTGAYIGVLSGAVVGSPVRGALIGGGAGAAAGLTAILLTRGPEAELPRGTMLDVVFDHALLLDADHLPANDPGKLSQPLVPIVSQQETHRHERYPRRTLPGLPFPFLRF